MLSLGSLAFAAPWLLSAAVALPIIWWLLRVTPPAPRRVRVPGDPAAARADPARGDAGAHAAVADRPAHDPRGAGHPRAGASGAEPAGAARRQRAADPGDRRRLGGGARLAGAPAGGDSICSPKPGARTARSCSSPPRRSRSGQPAPPLQPVRAADARAAVQALAPKPWAVDRGAALARLKALPLSRQHQRGLAQRRGRGRRCRRARRGARRARQRCATSPRRRRTRRGWSPRAPRRASAPARICRWRCEPCRRRVRARSRCGRAPRTGALLARETATVEAGGSGASIRLAMPGELRNRVTRIDIEGEASAGGVLLLDERWRRRPVGIAASANPVEPAAAQRDLLPPARARPVHRNAPRPGRRIC